MKFRKLDVLAQLLVIASITICHASSKTPNKSATPNVLFIVVDDLRPMLGCYGDDIVSPNIDQLARISMKFTNAHVQQAVCAPSRVSFLTGRRPDTTRLYDFGSYWRTASGNFTTLPQHFMEHGYFSAGIGKVFHQGKPSNFTFDYPYSWSIPNYWPSTEKYIGDKVCNTPEGKKHNLLCPVDLTKQPEMTLPDIQNADYAVNLLKNIYEEAPYVDFFGHNRTMQEPFFIGLGFRKPHVPYKYPAKFKDLYPLDSIKIAKDKDLPPGLPSVAYAPYLKTLDNYQDIHDLNLSFPYGPMPDDYHYLIRQNYYSSVSYMDYQLGRVLSALDKYGFSDNTIISFIGDHGWQLGEHSEFSKFTNYIYATKVPFLIHVPGVTDRNFISEKKFPLIDPLKFKRKPASSMKPSGDFILDASGPTKGHVYHRKDDIGPGPATNAFAELVDLFPTISDLAGLKVPDICPKDSHSVTTCREGMSLAPLIKSHSTGGPSNVKNCTISQYPRPSDIPQKHSILPPLDTIVIMGYSMRTNDYRYSEWVGFNHTTFQMDWDDLHANELYILADDPHEDNNVAGDERYSNIVKEMRENLHQGWRGCIL